MFEQNMGVNNQKQNLTGPRAISTLSFNKTFGKPVSEHHHHNGRCEEPCRIPAQQRIRRPPRDGAGRWSPRPGRTRAGANFPVASNRPFHPTQAGKVTRGELHGKFWCSFPKYRSAPQTQPTLPLPRIAAVGKVP